MWHCGSMWHCGFVCQDIVCTAAGMQACRSAGNPTKTGCELTKSVVRLHRCQLREKRNFSPASVLKIDDGQPRAPGILPACAPTHDGALLDWRLPPGVRSSYGPVAAVVGALGDPAAGAPASGCAHSRLPPHAALPFVGSFLCWCARPVCLDNQTLLIAGPRSARIPRVR
jgi:hypothetical protein